jgi:site-specific DNA-methyltransferase (adenine-specific)
MNTDPARHNRTLRLSDEDRHRLRPALLSEASLAAGHEVPTGTIYGDCLTLPLPAQFVDLLILDPPYNLNKTFKDFRFERRSVDDYTTWLSDVLTRIKPTLKPTASIYICGDWLSSASIFPAAAAHFTVRNRITWEREKGRGAAANWKNVNEDIWFCTMSDQYTFNLDAVKLRRQVIAPYKNAQGQPKDWTATDQGNVRNTHPSNFWSDITVPFWSMPENTEHPTQKSEKLLAKLILASSNPTDRVFDPFVGSGTTTVVAKKLGRQYLGIDLNEEYCLLTERRLELAEERPQIQGFADGVFWERNSGSRRAR